MRFEHPTSRHEETRRAPWLFNLLFFNLYWAHVGCWRHFAIQTILFAWSWVLIVAGAVLMPPEPTSWQELYAPVYSDSFWFFGIWLNTLTWLAYPFYANGIVRNHYLRNGWRVAG